MNNLDDKLREILRQPHQDSLGATVMSFPTQKMLENIKQAFADEADGYVVKIGDKYMTGQDWYDRFQTAKMGVVLETGTQNITRSCVFAAWDKADEAAKKASGL